MYLGKQARYAAVFCCGLISCLILSNLAIAHNHIGRISYQDYSLATSNVHVVKIPHNAVRKIRVKVAPSIQPLKKFLTPNKTVAALNGGYFDPGNQKTASYVIQDGQIIADPRTNARLIDNPKLDPYLGKVLNRSEFRRYRCGPETRYDIVFHREPTPSGCSLVDSLGAGPQMLPENTSTAEAFTAYKDGKLVRNAIGENLPNARSAIAITKDNDVLLVMVEQLMPKNSGMSLVDLGKFLRGQGVVKALNLDGGSSSTLYYKNKLEDELYYGRLDREGNKVIRSVKSVLVVE